MFSFLLKDFVDIHRKTIDFASVVYHIAMSGAAEDLDMFGFYQNSQVPGAWMGAAYAFFNSIERDQKINQKDSSNSAADSVTVKPPSRPKSTSRSTSRSSHKKEIEKGLGEEVIDVEKMLNDKK